MNDRLSVENACFRTVGERLVYLRTSAGHSCREVSEATGISLSELSRLETGKRRLDDWHIAKLAEIYDVETAHFIELIKFDPTTRVARFRSTSSSEASAPVLSTFPGYELSAIRKKGLPPTPAHVAKLALQFAIGAKCYCIWIDTDEASPVLPIDSLTIVDPDARTILGDLVVNTMSWDPAIINIRRDGMGTLYGTDPNGEHISLDSASSIKQFHKILAIFPPSYLFQGTFKPEPLNW